MLRVLLVLQSVRPAGMFFVPAARNSGTHSAPNVAERLKPKLDEVWLLSFGTIRCSTILRVPAH